MTPKARLLLPVLWCGAWGAIMFPAGGSNLLMRRYIAPIEPFNASWMEILAWSYLGLGPFMVVAAWRLHKGRAWPRYPLQAFLVFMLIGLAALPFLMFPMLRRMFDGMGEHGGPPVFFRVFMGMIVVLQCAVFIAFGGVSVWALRCLRSEDVRSHASQSGF